MGSRAGGTQAKGLSKTRARIIEPWALAGAADLGRVMAGIGSGLVEPFQ